MTCSKCGHTHKEKECFNAFCSKCGCGGNLLMSSRGCKGMKQLNRQIETYLKSVYYPNNGREGLR